MWRWGKQVQVGLGGPGDACWFGILAARAWGLHVHDARWLVTVSEIRLGFCYLGSGGGGEEGVAGNLHAECGKRSKVCVKMLQNWSRTRDAPLLSAISLPHSRVVSLSLSVPSASTLCALCQRRRLRLRRQRRRCLYLFLFFFLRLQNFFTFGFGFSTLLRRLRSRRSNGADDDDDDDEDGDDDAGYYLYELALSSERQHFQSESDKQRTPNRAVRSARSVAKISVIRVFSSSSSFFFLIYLCRVLAELCIDIDNNR